MLLFGLFIFLSHFCATIMTVMYLQDKKSAYAAIRKERELMASEMLSKVLDAENADRQAQKNAADRAQEIIESARAAGEERVKAMKAEAAEKAAKLISGAEAEAKKRESEAEAEAEKRGAQVISQAAAHRTEAVRAVMEVVIP